MKQLTFARLDVANIGHIGDFAEPRPAPVSSLVVGVLARSWHRDAMSRTDSRGDRAA